MPLRDGSPTPRASRSHFFLSVSRGEAFRSVAVRPSALYAGVCVAPCVMAAVAAGMAYGLLHEGGVVGIASQDTAMRIAYERRIAALNSQVETLTSRRSSEQSGLEDQLRLMAGRQAQIETRASAIAALLGQAGLDHDVTGSIPTRSAPPSITAPRVRNPLIDATRAAAPPPSSVSAFAPVEAPPGHPAIFDEKPRPEGLGAQSRLFEESPVREALAEAAPLASRLSRLSSAIERIDQGQTQTVGAIRAVARATTTRVRAALMGVGLNPDRLAAMRTTRDRAVGGPLAPLPAAGLLSPLDVELARLQDDVGAADRLRRLLPSLPFRKPIDTALDMTSPFGPRVDPFLGKLAMHTGVDLREQIGAPARATAAGRVVTAGWSGGYGNMVEIDHGDGLATRYGHLSQILVSDGQHVEAGALIGRVGSTGRSTGAHLHYEVRIDGEAVDPTRFLRAGAELAALR